MQQTSVDFGHESLDDLPEQRLSVPALAMAGHNTSEEDDNCTGGTNQGTLIVFLTDLSRPVCQKIAAKR